MNIHEHTINIYNIFRVTPVENRKLAHLDVEVESSKDLCARAKRSSKEVPETSSRNKLSRGQGPVLPEPTAGFHKWGPPWSPHSWMAISCYFMENPSYKWMIWAQLVRLARFSTAANRGASFPSWVSKETTAFVGSPHPTERSGVS